MTDTETSPEVTLLTYAGSFRRAQVNVPGRTVAVERGKRYGFTVEEITHLDPEAWLELRPKPQVPADELLAGTVAQVLKALDDNTDRAGELLEAERAGADRKGVTTALEALVAANDETTNEADSAATQGS
ncbi:MAG: hypothetical protein JWM89_1804 [Acidimicrobiales bacterium]|nr:hypothetical protein [Acidimicrobiales bacterium]